MRFRDSHYSAQRSCAVGSEVVFIYAEYFLFFSFQVIQRLRYDFPGLFICRDLQLAKDSHGGEADCKELVNPWWVIRQFFTDGSPTPYGYTAGVRPIKVASLGT